MECPICKKTMVILTDPQINLQPVQEQGQEFPINIVCYLYRFFTCQECKIKVSQAETKDYK